MEKVSLLLLEEMVDSCLKVGRRLSSVSAASPFAVQSRSSIWSIPPTGLFSSLANP